MEIPPKVLIIDDEKRVRRILELQLKSEGFELIQCDDSREAIAIIEDENIDLVISDIRMPVITGEEILSFIVKKKPDIPVIMLTGVVDVEMAVKVMKAGAFDYLIKPVKRNELLITVRKAMDYRYLLKDKERLEKENIEYQHKLEAMVQERTRALRQALENLERIHIDTVKILASAIEEKDPYIRGHSNRVRIMSRALAKQIGFREEQLKRLEFGALLHDIGKIAVTLNILNKPGPLSKEEMQIIQKHPIIGERIVRQVDYFQDIAPIIRWHHERYDGKGYPDGIAGEEIPIQSRLISIVDAYDAMTSDRAYRKALPIKKALDILEEEKGGQFDPELVHIFISNKIYKAIDEN